MDRCPKTRNFDGFRSERRCETESTNTIGWFAFGAIQYFFFITFYVFLGERRWKALSHHSCFCDARFYLVVGNDKNFSFTSVLIRLQVPALQSASFLSLESRCSSTLLLIDHQHSSRDTRNLTNTPTAARIVTQKLHLNLPVGVGSFVIRKLSLKRSTGEKQ